MEIIVVLCVIFFAVGLYFGNGFGRTKALSELKDYRKMLRQRRDEIFKKLADAYGIRYLQIAAVEDMDSGIEDFLSDDEATLLEVIIDPKLVV